MLRAILGVIVGYIAMVAIVFICLTVAYMALGADKVYEPMLYDVSMTWIIVSLVVGLVASIVGGLVCALIGKGTRAPIALVVVVIALGGVGVAFEAAKERPAIPPARGGDVTMFEAMQHTRQPLWVAIANPIVGVVGVLIGAGLVKGKGGMPAPH